MQTLGRRKKVKAGDKKNPETEIKKNKEEAIGELERFISSEEGQEWLQAQGWVKAKEILENALVLKVRSENVLESILALTPGNPDENYPPKAGWAHRGKIALVEEDHGNDR